MPCWNYQPWFQLEILPQFRYTDKVCPKYCLQKSIKVWMSQIGRNTFDHLSIFWNYNFVLCVLGHFLLVSGETFKLQTVKVSRPETEARLILDSQNYLVTKMSEIVSFSRSSPNTELSETRVSSNSDVFCTHTHTGLFAFSSLPLHCASSLGLCKKNDRRVDSWLSQCEKYLAHITLTLHKYSVVCVP